MCEDLRYEFDLRRCVKLFTPANKISISRMCEDQHSFDEVIESARGKGTCCGCPGTYLLNLLCVETGRRPLDAYRKPVTTLGKLYHKWRCHKYRLRFDQIARNRMREKVTASMLFRDRKSSYHKSVSHPFRGDYVRLRHNVKWKKTAAETGDQYVVFADIINKIARASGKCLQTLFVVSTSAMLVMDQRTLQIKYRIPATDIFRISLSPFVDDLAVFHVRAAFCCSQATRKKGDFLFETGHVIEIVTKLYLVIQNATESLEVNIATEFEANFGKESVVLAFKCTGLLRKSSRDRSRSTGEEIAWEVVL
ncbi:unconventional myosin-Ib [Caerostris extrusa]|uniref:Unconventional myosin-Ib n=1 Tax=Caerostris extrusa TaxID=172846 RepID=A0AAV4TFL8_CAEEX|nr:unconventional myosin-Ib [Caerostris extrusa]